VLPPTHIVLTWLAFDLLERRLPALRDVDRRLLAVATSVPDLIDKPLAAAYFYRRHKAAMLFAHTLLAQLVVVAVTATGVIRWPYALAFLLHALQDRSWLFQDTFWWPLRGWRFHVWRKQGSEQPDIHRAYWRAFTRRPELLVWEALGLLALIWLIWRHRLYHPQRLLWLLRTGRFPE
jgi:hypothetical protein